MGHVRGDYGSVDPTVPYVYVEILRKPSYVSLCDVPFAAPNKKPSRDLRAPSETTSKS